MRNFPVATRLMLIGMNAEFSRIDQMRELVCQFVLSDQVSEETTNKAIDSLLEEWDVVLKKYFGMCLGDSNKTWLRQMAIEHRNQLLQ